jgi:hypothetical protein
VDLFHTILEVRHMICLSICNKLDSNEMHALM